MSILVGFMVAVFVAVCILLVIVILLQDSKGEGLSSSAFGGSGLESVLGGHGATTFFVQDDNLDCYQLYGHCAIFNEVLWRI